MENRFIFRMRHLCGLLEKTEVFTRDCRLIATNDAFEMLRAMTVATKTHHRKVFIIGNGASASMASHIATDLCKNGKINTSVFTDASLLTAVANDIGAESIFSVPLEMMGEEGDLLVAISSSGNSPNIIKAIQTAHSMKIHIITLSAMSADNSIRSLGDLNFYVPGSTYSNAETCHAAILHYWVDLITGDIPADISDENSAADTKATATK